MLFREAELPEFSSNNPQEEWSCRLLADAFRPPPVARAVVPGQATGSGSALPVEQANAEQRARTEQAPHSSADQRPHGSAEQVPKSSAEQRPQGSAELEPRGRLLEEAREQEIVAINKEMNDAMQALSDGAVLMANLLGQIRIEPGVGLPQVTEPTPIWKKVSELFQTLPDNTHCLPEKFPEVFGEDVAALLNQMNVQKVSHWVTPDGKHHYGLDFPQKKTHYFKTAEMTHEPSIQFEVAIGPDGIKLDEFQGLKVKKADGTFTATIDRVTIKPEGANVVIEGQGHWFFFKGSKRLVLGPDGKPLPEPEKAKQP